MSKFKWQVLKGVGMVVAVAWLYGCAGTTSVQEKHPLIASAGATDSAKVYFIRPDPGFRGVMNMPLDISLDGTELLSLAKGQYTLLSLKPGSTEMKLDFHTVVGTTNTMTAVTTKNQLTFSPGETQYLVFELVSREPLNGSEFVPRPVSRDRAIEVTRGLSPVGAAVREPIQ